MQRLQALAAVLEATRTLRLKQKNLSSWEYVVAFGGDKTAEVKVELKCGGFVVSFCYKTNAIAARITIYSLILVLFVCLVG